MAHLLQSRRRGLWLCRRGPLSRLLLRLGRTLYRGLRLRRLIVTQAGQLLAVQARYEDRGGHRPRRKPPRQQDVARRQTRAVIADARRLLSRERHGCAEARRRLLRTCKPLGRTLHRRRTGAAHRLLVLLLRARRAEAMVLLLHWHPRLAGTSRRLLLMLGTLLLQLLRWLLLR